MRLATSTRITFLASVSLALVVSACGGGGGGGTGPIPGGGNGPGATPTPHSTASGAPTATPTPVKTATPPPTPPPTPIPTPVATPTSSGQSITMLPDTTGRFGLTQILDNYAGQPQLTAAQIQSEAPNYDSVWGAFQPQTWRASSAKVILSRYMLPIEDDNLVSGHDLNWWKANHPDWILYACDANGNPTNDLAWSGTGFPDVPLAFYMPAVQQYQMQLLIPYLQANGYNALAADNTDLTNYILGGNPNFGQSHTAGEYGCGTKDANGNLVRRYGVQGQKYSPVDPQFAADMIGWAAQTSAALHAAGLKFLINHPVDTPPTNANEQQLVSYVDGMVDENGFTHYGNLLTGNAFANTLTWVEYAQTHHVAVLVTDYFCTGGGCSDDPNSLTPQQVDWALSSYAIGNEGGEDVYISPHGGSNFSYRSEYSTKFGAPCGAYSQPSAGVYVRKFSGGLSIVNASGAPYTYTLPAHTYFDVEGRAIPTPFTLNSPDGFMLTTSGGVGCT